MSSKVVGFLLGAAFAALTLFLIYKLLAWICGRLATAARWIWRLGRRPAATADPNGGYVVFDLETTGLSAADHEIIEIAGLKISPKGEIVESFQSLVIPEGRISPAITKLTGIDQMMIAQDGVPLGEAMSRFRSFAGDLPLVAFNAPFDKGFLHHACFRMGMPVFGNSFHCALETSRRAWPGRPSYKLSALAEEAGLDLANEHRALADCQRTAYLMFAALNKLGTSFR
ncbi:3'-5' exonuclease [Sphingomonadaceae bacterium G21617-S1]|nr:3'-5' exonuclease [Sphingomonadaceae bacterium G21617-S1]